MHRLTAQTLLAPALVALLVLAACTAATAPKSLRDSDVPIYSSAVFDPARLPGTWQQAGDAAPSDAPACHASGLRITQDGSGLAAQGQLCLAGALTDVTGPLRLIGPGRLASPAIGEPVWVLWADADYRTLVLGTPSGAFGLVLNRAANPPADPPAALPADRALAARDILHWNGYDTALLRM